MLDVEKVIKGLECCKWSDAGRYDGFEPVYENCEKCPYNNEEVLQSECCEELTRNALELLKEQEAKLPKKITKIGGLMKGICPNVLCNAEINSVSNEMACGYCGQAVKWE